jgi:hypothetical protein
MVGRSNKVRIRRERKDFKIIFLCSDREVSDVLASGLKEKGFQEKLKINFGENQVRR